MSSKVYNVFAKSNPFKRAQMIAVAPLYIKNSNMLNVIRTFDINYMGANYRMIEKFNKIQKSDPTLDAQIDNWLKNINTK